MRAAGRLPIFTVGLPWRMRSGPAGHVALSLSRLFWSRTRQLDLTQDELASLAGMSRQTANRALNNLQQLGVISLSMNRITVLDDTALTRIMLPASADEA
jgi:CRP-like cAMP-binding protein